MSLRRINKKATTIMIGLMIMIFVFTGCSTSTSVPEDAVAVVNGNSLSMDDFNKHLAQQRAGIEEQYGSEIFAQDTGEGMTLLDTIKDRIVQNMILEAILLQEAEKSGVEVTDEEVEELYGVQLQFMEQSEAFQQLLEENDIDEAFLRNQAKKHMLIEKYQDYFIEELEMDETAARAFYDENPEQFQIEEVTARHILVIDDREKAEEILAEINNQEDFDAVADRYEEAEEEGIIVEDLGSFGRGRMVIEFEEAVFSMEAGEVSGIVETQFGYHIVLVQDVINETYTFEDMEGQIILYLGEMELQNHIGGLLEEADIAIREDL